MQKVLNLFCRKQNMQQQKYSLWTCSKETTTDITLSPLVSIDYVENPELALQKTEYAATKPMDIYHRNSNRYIVFLLVQIDASFFFECGISSLFYVCLFFKWVFLLHGRATLITRKGFCFYI